ncbi:MAG: recombinase family protein [Planctomycetes bacterium]|nr:recombinase family protein [Planctomycetota bacterium]
MKAIGYTRCSTHEQADSGLGLDVQTQRIRAYCGMKDMDLIEIVTDAGVSGGKPLASREGGQRLLDAIRKRKAGAVVMLKLDRMFRNAGDCLTVTDKWERSGISLHIVDLGGNAIDTTSAAGRFMLVVLAGAAEMERNLTRERTRSAMAVKRANGQRVGAVPYGFDVVGDGVTLIGNSAEQAVIREIRAMRKGGASFRRIAEELTKQGVPTKTGKSSRWTHQAVARILDRMQPRARSCIPTTTVGELRTG